MRSKIPRRFESLEPRLAMAGMYSFPDVDGDIVTVRASRGTDAQLETALGLRSTGVPGGFQLERVVLANPVFARTDLTITARRGPAGGDGQVNVGEIQTSFDLGRVSVGGDLGRIVAGDVNRTTPGVAALAATSVGAWGTFTGAGDTFSYIVGPVPSVRLAGDLDGARFFVTGRAADVVIGGNISGRNPSDGFEAGSIGSIVVGRNVSGGGFSDSGRIAARTGGIDRVVIGGGLIGGLGDTSGVVTSVGRIGLARIGGSISGGGFGTTGGYSGVILTGAGITRLVVAGGIFGGGGPMFSGGVYAVGAIGSAVVGGSIEAGFGTGYVAGFIKAGSIGTLDVGGGIVGGSGLAGGYVHADGRIGTLRVGRVAAGDGEQSGSVQAGSIGIMVVRGDILGSGRQPAMISARGAFTPTGPRAIDSLTVGGSMAKTVVLGGYVGTTPVNGAARIGAVTVRGSLVGSSIVAGIQNIGSLHSSGMPQFGDGLDMPIAGRRGSRIDSLVVNGMAIGSADPTDFSGVLANSIGTVRLGGRTHAVTQVGIAPTSPNLWFRRVS